MNISSYQLQNVIRAYGQRIRHNGLSKLKATNRSPAFDTISISPKAKRRQIIEKLAFEILSATKNQNETIASNQNLLEKLRKELDDNLEVLLNKDISLEDMKKLIERLEITPDDQATTNRG